MNTCVDHIARRQARLGHFTASPSPSPEASTNKDGEDGDGGDDDKDASASSDDEMTTSQGLALCHS